MVFGKERDQEPEAVELSNMDSLPWAPLGGLFVVELVTESDGSASAGPTMQERLDGSGRSASPNIAQHCLDKSY